MSRHYGKWSGEPEEPMTKATINVLHELAANLQYSTTHSAGLDLVACVNPYETEMRPGEHVLVSAGISLNLLPDQVAFIFPRSGLGIRNGIVLRNGTGVIDADYKGELKVCLQNNGSVSYIVDPGERIAQLVITNFQRIANVTVIEKERGTGGFGSTGT